MSKAAPVTSAAGTSPLFDKCFRFDDAHRIQRAGLYSFFRVVDSAQDPEVVIGGRRMVMLGSNNYLGLTNDPRVKEAAIEAIRKYGSGCAGSRFLNGTLDLHVILEERLASFMRQDAAVVFATGFQVNLGAISCLVGKGDSVYLDKQDHACIIDGARLSFGEVRKFKHNDPADLRRQMKNDTMSRGKLVVVDGVFSMEGDIAPLPEIVAVARDFEAAVMVDDAHGVGVLGPTGRGTAEHFGLEDEVDLIMGTFSKSMASVGGFIAGEATVIDYVKHRARTLIFSAAPPPASVAAALATVDIMEQEPERRERLWENTRFFAEGLRSLGLDTGDSETPVVPVVVGEDLTALRMVHRLHEEGIFVNCVLSPATPPGRALIRTSLMATHTKDHLVHALEAIEKVGREVGLVRSAEV
ncbi:MAG: pyridoxal phosphate-dependent aminotransferase family protein [Acidobacteria bacterium]|nr:pyridoxal phosphate-dependent aminotransferase family protein [Acidobacteriota bacterium]MCA1609599.1 pyridoxal phosphate-dependent aminotransferase family protein [Acidobacteriota bacterium]